MMGFVPASFEIVGYIVFAPMILGVSRVEAAVMGAVAWSGITSRVCAKNGWPDGEEIWNQKSDTTDDLSRGIL